MEAILAFSSSIFCFLYSYLSKYIPIKWVYLLNYFGLFCPPSWLNYFSINVFFFLSKCFYSHLPNKWAWQKTIPLCLINYFSIYVSVYFCMYLPCPFIGPCPFIRHVRLPSWLKYSYLPNNCVGPNKHVGSK